MAGRPWVIAAETAADVAGFLTAHLPPWADGPGWDHMFSTAYQVGCQALVALGYAEERPWGAVPKPVPSPPGKAPRWDDLCVAVLWLADQQGRLCHLRPDGGIEPTRVGPWTVVPANPPPPPLPNIAPAHGLGPARATDDARHVLGQLGLVRNGAWTEAAETVLWRCQPREWEMRVTDNPRFKAGVDRACMTLPKDIRAEIGALARVTEADLQAYAAEHAARYGMFGARANADRPPPDPMETARRMIPLQRHHALDGLFFRRWRLDDGWLSGPDAARALEIFNDPLASAMRRAVMARLHPTSPVASGPAA